MAYDEIKRMIINILKRTPKRNIKWNTIYELLLSQGYPKSSVSMAKSQLLEEGIIEEYNDKNGNKIIELVKEPLDLDFSFNGDDFSEERFREYHEDKIRQYFKSKLSVEGPQWDIFDVEEYRRLTLDLEIVEDIVNYPFEVRRIISEIYKDAYYELFGEKVSVMVKFRNIGNVKKLSEIGSDDVGKLVEFDAIILKASRMKSRVVVATFRCPRCGAKKTMELGLWDDPDQIGSKLTCPRDNCNSKQMMYRENESIHTNFQELLVQQPLELSPDGRQHTRVVFIEGHSLEVYSGRVRIVGVPIKKKVKKGTSVSDIYVLGFYYEQIDKQEVNLTDEDIKKIEMVAKDKNVIQKLANAMFREIEGHDVIKKAIFLQQIKGAKKPGKRHDIHILLITDPGVGKTTLMKRLEDFPNNKYVSLTTATGAGLSAAVVKEKTEFGDSWVVKPGALVLADDGTCCIDEIGINKKAMEHILEAMESQTIHVNKGGIDAILSARCAILGACNPKYGSFDENLTVWEQIDLPSPVLSRFDLIFPIMDKLDKEKDRRIAEYIVDFGNKMIEEVEDKITINGIEITDEFLTKYIMYARQFRPIIGKDAKKILVDFYVKMREIGEKKGIKAITTRQFESLLRISEAIAKAKLKNVVDKEDAEEAIDLMMTCLRQIAYDPDENEINIDKIFGVTKSERNKLSKVMEVFEKNGAGKLLDFDTLLELTGLNENELRSILEKLKKYGDIDEPRPGKYRLL